MGKSLEQLGQEMSSWEFGMHLADYRDDPWDEQRADFRSAMIISAVANMMGGKTKPLDFMPYHPSNRPHTPTPEEIMKAGGLK